MMLFEKDIGGRRGDSTLEGLIDEYGAPAEVAPAALARAKRPVAWALVAADPRVRRVLLGLVAGLLTASVCITFAAARPSLAAGGSECLVIELIFAGLFLVPCLILPALKLVEAPPAFAMTTGLGALFGQCVLCFLCDTRAFEHLLAFHTGAVAVAIGVGLGVAHLRTRVLTGGHMAPRRSTPPASTP